MSIYEETFSRRDIVANVLAAPLTMSLVARTIAGASWQAALQDGLDDLHDVLAQARESSGLPAVAAGVTKNGRLVACGAVGLRRIDASIPVQAGDKFPIGSCTKAMTATLVAMFIEEGKLNWDSTLTDLFPQESGQIHPSCRNITVEMMLQHRSGLDTHHFVETFPGVKASIQQLRLRTVGELVTHPPMSEPGAKFLYTGAGYVILASALEQITGRSWEELLSNRLFEPLGMTTAGFGMATRWDRADQPLGHILRSDGSDQYVIGHGSLAPVHGPAGTVYCSISDYLKFADNHASSGDRGARLLKRDTYTKLHQPGAGQSYAMGWGVGHGDWAKGPVLTHTGITYNQGYSYSVSVAPGLGVSIATAATAYTADGRVFKPLGRVINQLEKKFAALD